MVYYLLYRIERYWRDVYYGYTSDLENVFMLLEHHGYLNIDDPKHMLLLHMIFLPRINDALEFFRNAWNQHPLSTERNRTPTQLMLMSMPPDDQDLELNQVMLSAALHSLAVSDLMTQLPLIILFWPLDGTSRSCPLLQHL